VVICPLLQKAFISFFSYGPLGLAVPWQGCALAMLSSKHANMHGNDTKVFVGFREVSLKATQSMLQKTITWIKKSVKGHNKWHRACFHARLSH
jgi:hypothetical protein